MKLSKEDAIAIGKDLRTQDNMLVGSFAAEIMGEGYPFSKEMCKVVFDTMTDEALGRRFMKWELQRNGK